MWRQAHQQSFEAIREAVREAAPLAHVDKSAPFVVETDASREHLGAVLKQNDRVVRMLHRTLKPAERALPITLLELLAVLFALGRWEKYLLGRHFKIVTDHQALTWIGKQKSSNGKLAEWAFELSQYDYEIIYKPGAELGLADSISRMVGLVEAREVLPTTEEF